MMSSASSPQPCGLVMMPALVNLPGLHHAIITIAFYGPNRKTVHLSVQSVEKPELYSGAGVQPEQGLELIDSCSASSRVYTFVVSNQTHEADQVILITPTMYLTPCGHSAPEPISWKTHAGNEMRCDTIRYQGTFVLIHNLEPVKLAERIGITVVVEAGEGPDGGLPH